MHPSPPCLRGGTAMLAGIGGGIAFSASPLPHSDLAALGWSSFWAGFGVGYAGGYKALHTPRPATAILKEPAHAFQIVEVSRPQPVFQRAVAVIVRPPMSEATGAALEQLRLSISARMWYQENPGKQLPSLDAIPHYPIEKLAEFMGWY